jgi:ADP-L-glycero-D-manno-heptose 6-epimerase
MIVVTGAAGFIGSNIVAALNARGRSDIVAVDYFKAPEPAQPLPRRPAYLDAMRVLQRVDARELAAWLDKSGPDVQAVIHMGACSDTTQSDRAFIMAVNTEYTRALWQWCTRAARPLIYASSAATYGDGSAGYDDRVDPSIYRPLNLYGQSKQDFDLWAMAQRLAPARWAGLKFFNVYGPREGHKGRMASVAFHAYNQICQAGHARLFKSHRPDFPDGGQQRDFIFVADAVAAVLHFLDTPASASAPNGLYNVGTGKARSFADLVTAVFTAMGRPANIEYFPMPEDLRGKYQYFTQAETSKLRAAGFKQAMHDVEDGVAEYVQFLQTTKS